MMLGACDYCSIAFTAEMGLDACFHAGSPARAHGEGYVLCLKKLPERQIKTIRPLL